MAEEPKSQSWWQTLPGIFTALAGVITAIGGLVVALYQSGLFQHYRPETVPVASAPSATTSSAHAEAAATVDSQSASRVPPGPPPLPSKSVNLLAAENGGFVIVASSDKWVGTIDGKEEGNTFYEGTAQAESVYAFKDEKPATIGMFTMLISGTDDANVKQFELFVGNDSPTGAFESIGKFQTQNVKLFKTPYQEFKFPPVKARYLKIKLLSTYGSSYANVQEVQLFGRMEKK